MDLTRKFSVKCKSRGFTQAVNGLEFIILFTCLCWKFQKFPHIHTYSVLLIRQFRRANQSPSWNCHSKYSFELTVILFFCFNSQVQKNRNSQNSSKVWYILSLISCVDPQLYIFRICSEWINNSYYTVWRIEGNYIPNSTQNSLSPLILKSLDCLMTYIFASSLSQCSLQYKHLKPFQTHR